MDPSNFASFEGPEYKWKTPTYMYLLLLIGDLIDGNLFVTECGLILSFEHSLWSLNEIFSQILFQTRKFILQILSKNRQKVQMLIGL